MSDMMKLWHRKQIVDLSRIGLHSGVNPMVEHVCKSPVLMPAGVSIYRNLGDQFWVYSDLEGSWAGLPYCPFCLERLE